MDEAFEKRLNELAVRAARSGRVATTRFLDPALERAARHAANAAGASVAFYGGYEDAERRIAAFYSGDEPEEWEIPLTCLTITWREKYGSPAHRDVLGALMGLGMNREQFGDIAPAAPDAPGRKDGTGMMYLFLMEESASYVAASLTSCGRATVKLAPAEGEIKIAPPEGTVFRATVQSTRLDAVIAAGYKLSRSEARKIVESGLVKKNHAEELRPDAELKPGDLLSVRGRGRLKLEEIQGETRRGRTALQIVKY